jgi:hypothetical protein
MTTPDLGTAQFSVPPNMKIWLIDDVHWLVRAVPGLEPPVYVGWEVPSGTDLQSMVGPGQTPIVAQTITGDEAAAVGFLDFGTTTELANYGGEDPALVWEETYETQAAVLPWLRDPEVAALHFAALYEGRPVSEAELALTDWWQSHNETQREWAVLYYSDPSTAMQIRQDNRISMQDAFAQVGINNAPRWLTNWIADQITQGTWSETYAGQQIRALADPLLSVKRDDRLSRLMDRRLDERLDTTRTREQEVLDMATEWLGPQFGRLSQRELERWAHRFRTDPDARDAFRQHLAGQRRALFPMYEDMNLTYEDIAAPWRSLWANEMGQTPDETDNAFIKMVKLNDADEAGKLMRRVGLGRGNGSMRSRLQEGLLGVTGGRIRRPI